VRVWRISRATHRDFDGEGARLRGGRWNHPGTPIVYISSSLALAALETLVHLVRFLPLRHLVAVPADIPDSVPIVPVRAAGLPRAWRAPSPPTALADIGTRWAEAGESAVLEVPSVIVPQEPNYLLNPRHQHFKRIRIGRPEPFYFDPRFWKP
jgi:RES domain-containing protein